MVSLLRPTPAPAAHPLRPAWLQVAWAAAGIALLSFFLPWAELDLRTPKIEKQFSSKASKSLSKVFGGRPSARPKSGSPFGVKAIPSRLSGFQIPLYANQEAAKTAMQLSELFTHKRERVGPKSYLVYLLPGLAVLFAWLITWEASGKSAVAAAGLACAALGFGGIGYLLVTDTRALYAVAIGCGLWASLGAYLLLAAAAVFRLFPRLAPRLG